MCYHGFLSKPIATHGLRIGIVSYDFYPPIGGLGVLVQSYLRALKRLFPENTYVVIAPGVAADEQGLVLGRLRYRKSGGCPLFSLVLGFTIGSIIRKHKLDLLHVHSGSGGVFLLRRPPCRLVVSAHHTYRQEADIVYRHSPLKRRWKLFMGRLEARTYRMAESVVCVSKDTAEAIISTYGVEPGRVQVIENPVRFGKAQEYENEHKDSHTVVFVGRLEPRKGILLLLDAFQKLRTEVPEANLRLVGFNLLGPSLKKIIHAKGLSSHVTVLGFVHDPFRLREMARATLVVVPSTLEGFGLVAAEAMAVGTCVVVSDAPGLKSVVENGRTGMTFPVGDSDACAKAMKEVLLDSTLRRRLIEAGRNEAKVRFDLDDRTRDLMEVFRESKT